MPTARELARFVEWELFAPETTRGDIERLCAAARRASVHSVCVNGSRVELAYARLEESGVLVTALVGFPLGAADGDAKRYEAEIAVDHGAQEIDFVLDVGRLKDGDRQEVLREMRDIVEAADERPVKVVLQTHLLTGEETNLACQLALDSGAEFVCNGTDFGTPAVSVEDIKLLRSAVGAKFGVKAAGGIRDAATALALIEAGATRIGTLVGADVIGSK
jgi:deoxyribose-phosphate aldolase